MVFSSGHYNPLMQIELLFDKGIRMDSFDAVLRER